MVLLIKRSFMAYISARRKGNITYSFRILIKLALEYLAFNLTSYVSNMDLLKLYYIALAGNCMKSVTLF